MIEAHRRATLSCNDHQADYDILVPRSKGLQTSLKMRLAAAIAEAALIDKNRVKVISACSPSSSSFSLTHARALTHKHERSRAYTLANCTLLSVEWAAGRGLFTRIGAGGRNH